MKYIVRSVFLIMLGLFMGQKAFAQLTSKNAVGARFGSASGLNYRYSISDARAFEAILSVQSNSSFSRFRAIGLYEYHKPLLGDLSWYYGFGASVGSYTYKAFTNNAGNYIHSKSELALSLEGIVGVEYAIPNAPISISLDVKPYFDFIQESSIRFFDPVGFSIRYKF